MLIHRTITHTSGLVQEEDIPITWLEAGDQVRVGFEKGTLATATFDLMIGTIIKYEAANG